MSSFFLRFSNKNGIFHLGRLNDLYFPMVASVSEWRLARPGPEGCCWECAVCCEAVEAGPRAGQEAGVTLLSGPG